jgi:hypothetical protein
MTANKTQASSHSVKAFLNKLDDPVRREECLKVLRMMQEATGHKAVMWGTSIVGFGSYHYKYESGREGDFMLVGFSPRKSNLTVYIITGFSRYTSLMEKLGKFKTGKSCLYLKKLEDVDFEVLTELVTLSSERVVAKYN